MPVNNDITKFVEDQASKNYMSIGAAEYLEKKEILKAKDNGLGDVEKIEFIDNTITADEKLVSMYGIRQSLVINNQNEDPLIIARSILSRYSKPEETIEVEVIGDLSYHVGYGVLVRIEGLGSYENALMYISNVTHTWVSDKIFTTKLTLTPSRVMDEREWNDTTNSDSEFKFPGGSSELWDKIYSILRQQVGKPYTDGGNGPDSFDCSGLVCYAYNQFKDEIGFAINRTTETMVNQGIEVDKDDKSSWQPGDIILCIGDGSYTPPGHVVIYCGNNRIIHAAGKSRGVVEEECEKSDIMYVRRVLPESTSLYGGEATVDLPTEWKNEVNSLVQDAVKTTISNMTKYGYKNKLKNTCKSYNIDPYLMLGLIAIESNGDPSDATAPYIGLCQVDSGSTDIATNIEQGCEHYNKMCGYMSYAQTHVCLSAYNSGNGTVYSALNSSGLDISTVTVKQLGDALYSYVKANKNWDPVEKQLYSTKVLYAQALLREKKALE